MVAPQWRHLTLCLPKHRSLPNDELPKSHLGGCRRRSSGFRVRYYPPIMENQMEKKMENEMETVEFQDSGPLFQGPRIRIQVYQSREGNTLKACLEHHTTPRRDIANSQNHLAFRHLEVGGRWRGGGGGRVGMGGLVGVLFL